MIKTILKNDIFEWIDVDLPEKAELQLLAEKYQLPQEAVLDCLQPEHLPKHEKIRDWNFIIARAFDNHSEDTDHSVRDLTRKVAVFYNPERLITIHRSDQDFFIEFKLLQIEKAATQMCTCMPLLHDLIQSILHTYEKPIGKSLDKLEEFEVSLVFKNNSNLDIKEIYLLKKRISVCLRMLILSKDVVSDFLNNVRNDAIYFNDLKDELDNLCFLTEQLSGDSKSLLDLHMSLASQRTNETMRLLTIFSVFFLPLTFIVGIYGMNFEFMPELKWKDGYYFTWGIMITVTLGLYFWFKRKGLM